MSIKRSHQPIAPLHQPPLNEFETHILCHKGTEPPFSGKYCNETRAGIYHCRSCGAALFSSDDKFSSACGWPSFDDTLPHAVTRLPDADGYRIEIVCANCGGHLGHVFTGEGYTPKNTRHCVNSASITLQPFDQETPQALTQTHPSITPATPLHEVALFAGGCFWGIEDFFSRTTGVIQAISGYTGGTLENPCYEDVCEGDTGHAEVVKIEYDPQIISYEELAKLFFEIHDPTQLNRQGPDFGTQYRSAVFYINEEQQRTIESLIAQLKRKGYAVVTQLAPAEIFYPAETYHQQYFKRNPSPFHCHKRTKRFD